MQHPLKWVKKIYQKLREKFLPPAARSRHATRKTNDIIIALDHLEPLVFYFSLVISDQYGFLCLLRKNGEPSPTLTHPPTAPSLIFLHALSPILVGSDPDLAF